LQKSPFELVPEECGGRRGEHVWLAAATPTHPSPPKPQSTRRGRAEREEREKKSMASGSGDNGGGAGDGEFYLRYYVGHKGKFGHEFLEFEFRPDGKLRYANNSNYKNDTMIRKEVFVSPSVVLEAKRIIEESEVNLVPVSLTSPLIRFFGLSS
jgi:hypothetical protein